jgi:hypothetical protein
MNALTIVSNEYPYEINGAAHVRRQADFVIDGVGLGTRLAFEPNRPWIGETCFELQPGAFESEVDSLRGLRATWNQFGTGRFALYRCHCGCDYCGIFSCVIVRTETTVTWTDVRYEDGVIEESESEGPDEEHPYPHKIDTFSFDVTEYDSAIQQFMAENGRSSNATRPPA